MRKNRTDRNRRIQPQAEVERDYTVELVSVMDVPLERVSIRKWHPDLEAKEPAEQVHFILVIGEPDDPEPMELALRFKSPDTLGFLIEELIAYRKNVWADAEPINPDATLEDIDEREKAEKS